ncbi:MAG: hypothetical protein WBR28_29155 [Mycobacterium sp.]
MGDRFNGRAHWSAARSAVPAGAGKGYVGESCVRIIDREITRGAGLVELAADTAIPSILPPTGGGQRILSASVAENGMPPPLIKPFIRNGEMGINAIHYR